MAMFLVRELTRASLPEIGQLFGGRDHTTVLYAIQKVQELSESDREVQAILRALKEKVG
jgi:chromosomal replication initiator protein